MCGNYKLCANFKCFKQTKIHLKYFPPSFSRNDNDFNDFKFWRREFLFFWNIKCSSKKTVCWFLFWISWQIIGQSKVFTTTVVCFIPNRDREDIYFFGGIPNTYSHSDHIITYIGKKSVFKTSIILIKPVCSSNILKISKIHCQIAKKKKKQVCSCGVQHKFRIISNVLCLKNMQVNCYQNQKCGSCGFECFQSKFIGPRTSRPIWKQRKNYY